MKIESLIKRVGGTVIDMDAPKRQYHFKPEDGQPHEAPHVAIVGEMTHAKALLRIREGFRAVDGQVEQDGELGDADGFLPDGAALIGSNVHSGSYEIAGGETILLGDLVVMAFGDSGLSYEQWQELPDQERYDFIDATLRELQAGEGVLDDEDQPKQPAPVAEETPAAPTPAAPVQEETPEAPAVVEEQPNAQVEEEPKPVVEKPAVEESKPATEKPLAERPRKELAALYKKRFNREPSPRMTIADIAAALSEDD